VKSEKVGNGAHLYTVPATDYCYRNWYAAEPSNSTSPPLCPSPPPRISPRIFSIFHEALGFPQTPTTKDELHRIVLARAMAWGIRREFVRDQQILYNSSDLLIGCLIEYSDNMPVELRASISNLAHSQVDDMFLSIAC